MKNKYIYVLVLVIAAALILLFYFVKPKNTTVDQNIIENPKSYQSTGSVFPSTSKIFELMVKNRKLISGPETVSVEEGDNITIRITADEDDQLHLHGYDKSVNLAKDEPAELSFIADMSGRFVYELENAEVEIGALEVSPK